MPSKIVAFSVPDRHVQIVHCVALVLQPELQPLWVDLFRYSLEGCLVHQRIPQIINVPCAVSQPAQQFQLFRLGLGLGLDLHLQLGFRYNEHMHAAPASMM